MPQAVIVPRTPSVVGRQQTDDDGRFEFDSFPGKVHLRAKSGMHGVASLEFTLMPGEQRSLPPIVLDTENAIRGRVIDPEGRPVQNVKVVILAGKRSLQTMDIMQGGLRTDRDGWFAAIAEEGVYTVRVRPDVEPTAAAVSGVRPGDPPVIIQMGLE